MRKNRYLLFSPIQWNISNFYLYYLKNLCCIYLFFLNKLFSQLWLDRTCLINLNINSTICENLHQYKNIEDIVQKEVSRLNIAGSYIQTVPSIIISLLLGNFQINFCSLYKSFPKNLSNHILANVFEFRSSLFHKSFFCKTRNINIFRSLIWPW